MFSVHHNRPQHLVYIFCICTNFECDLVLLFFANTCIHSLIAAQSAIPAQGLLPIQQQPMQPQQQQQQFNAQNTHQQFIGVNQVQWKANMNTVSMQNTGNCQNTSRFYSTLFVAKSHRFPNFNLDHFEFCFAPEVQLQQQHLVKPNQSPMNANTVMEQQPPANVVKKEGCSVPLFVANLQAPPTLPPDNIVSDQDRQIQMNYEQWLNTQEKILNNQRQYYETEVSKLRKTRKSLNSKQRLLKKTGNELPEVDTIELTKVTSDQTVVQKQLENARKQWRQHTLIKQDYKNKQQQRNFSKQIAQPQVQQQQMVSPINQGTQSTISSPSPVQQSNMMQISAQPGNPMMQPSMSPLHSPSPRFSGNADCAATFSGNADCAALAPSPTAVNSIMQSPG